MEIDFREAVDAPVERIYIAAAILKNLRGKKSVEVQLFRLVSNLQEIEALKGHNLVGKADPAMPAELLAGASEEAALACLAEAFTLEEIELIKKYLLERYAGQVEKMTICPMNIPVPLGLGPLQAIPESEKSGFVHFDKAPDYHLPFAFKGYYDLGE